MNRRLNPQKLETQLKRSGQGERENHHQIKLGFLLVFVKMNLHPSGWETYPLMYLGAPLCSG